MLQATEMLRARNGGLEAPSPNGKNGTSGNEETRAATAGERETPANGRHTNGKFAAGNGGGPGNPFGRKLAELRGELINAVTKQDVRDIAVTLVMRAKAGDVAAAKLVLAYVVGKPAEQHHPDRLDLEELQLRRELPTTAADVPGMIHKLGGEMACTLVRAVTPAVDRDIATKFVEGSRRMDEREERARRRAEKKRQRRARR